MLRGTDTARDMREVQDKLDDLSRRTRIHENRIRPNRFTRFDNDLISRREMDSAVASATATAGGAVPVFQDLTPLLTETGTSWTLSEAPTAAGNVLLYLNGQQLRRVTAGPTATQFTVSGTAVVTGRSLTAGERLFAIFEGAGERMALEDLTRTLGESGTNWTLTNTPATDKIAVHLNGQLLLKVAAAPTATQYTQSGTTVVTGRTLTAGERLHAFYAF